MLDKANSFVGGGFIHNYARWKADLKEWRGDKAYELAPSVTFVRTATYIRDEFVVTG